MNIGIMRLYLRLPASRSLKTRRQAARSLTQRIRARFNVSVAHDAAADGEAWQSLTLAITAIASSPANVDAMLAEVAEFVIQTRPDLEVLDYGHEVISGL